MNDRPRALREPWRLELRRGLAALRAGDFADAEAHFTRAHRHAPAQPEVCYALGRERLRAGDAGAAEALLRTAWTADRSLISAAGTLARCLAFDRGQVEEAHRVLTEADQANGPSSAVAVVRAELLLEAGEVDRARAAAEAALTLCDREAAEGARRDSARQAASGVLARIENARGIALAEDGQHSEALFVFKRAADLDPAWSSPLVNIGASLLALDRPVSARRAFERAAERDPDNSTAFYNLGIVCRRLGDRAGARSAFEAAVLLAPRERAPVLALSRLLAEEHEVGP